MSALVQRKLEHARRRMDEGDVTAAVSLCEEVLAQAPRNPEALWILGMARLMAGEPQAAVGPLEQALATTPSNGMLLDGVGLAYLMLGRYDEAQRALSKAAAAPGAPAIVHMRLGIALMNLERYPEAAAELQHVLSREPQNIDALVNLGLTRARAGDVAVAERDFLRVLSEVPNHPHAMYNLGVLKLEAGIPTEAEEWFRKSVRVAPDYVDARVNLGVALQRQDRLVEAASELREAVVKQPAHFAALNALGQALAAQGQYQEARNTYVRALQVDEGAIAAREGLALANLALARYAEAQSHFREVLRAEPSNALTWARLANACLQTGALGDAQESAERARQLDPSLPDAYATLAQTHYMRGEMGDTVRLLKEGYAKTEAPALLGTLVHMTRRACDWESWQSLWPRMRAELDRGADVGSPFYLLCEDTTAAEQCAYASRYASTHFGAHAASAAPNKAPASTNERLRVGYFSPDFHEHATSYLLAEVLELHDRSRFEVFLYSYGPDDGSAMRARVQQSTEHFIDIAREPDDAVVRRMREDALDVLVELKGYTMGDRLAVLAQRPCSRQVSWLGYPGTTGAPFIDYIIADPHVIPAGSEGAYTERVLRMPQCYQPNDRKRAVAKPLSRREYGLPEQALVFCCFNQTVKYTPEMFACWMRLLQRVEGSVLWLLEDNAQATQNVIDAAQRAGVASNRLVFAARQPVAEHLARYRVADVALDTYPYGSHTTGSDALWSGCPLVAMAGETFASRVALSLLANCGVSELVATTFDEYEAVAYRLSTEADFRDGIRSTLKRARETAPLFGSAQFARDLEQLYLQITT